MNDKFYINDLSEIRAFCRHSDEEDIYKYIYSLQQENARLKDKNKKAIDKLEFYNSGEALYYVPIQEIIDILKEN